MTTHSIVKLLAQVRRSNGMSVLELADRAGYCESLFQKMECGARTPSLNSLQAWCEVLDYELVAQRREK